jgi:hypothetical protein
VRCDYCLGLDGASGVRRAAGRRACWRALGERSASTSGDVGTGRRRCWRHLRSSPGDADAEGLATNGDGISNEICDGIVRLTLFYR